MNGIDISNWQRGIDLSAVPCDFVIAKATEGTGYVSPSFEAQMNGAAANGKLLGVYHYINGSGAQAEMRHFYDTVRPWVGKAIICLDWESGGNSAWGNTAYLGQCIEAIKSLTGRQIVIYCSSSAMPWGLVQSTGCRAWVAQYASNANVYGYQQTPWNEGAYDCIIRQYTGAGRLDGYGGNLDLDKAYITASEWNAIAGYDGAAPSNGIKLGDLTNMEFICRPDEANYMFYYDGTRIHPAANPDELEAVQMCARACYGKNLPTFSLGTKDAPWGKRFMDIVSREA